VVALDLIDVGDVDEEKSEEAVRGEPLFQLVQMLAVGIEVVERIDGGPRRDRAAPIGERFF
jgi:hypothetical protein